MNTPDTMAIPYPDEDDGSFDAQTARIQLTKPYTRPQVAKLLGVSWDTVGVMIQDGRLATVLIGRRKMVLGEEVLRAMGARAAPPRTADTVAARKRRAREFVEQIREARGANRRRPREIGPSG